MSAQAAARPRILVLRALGLGDLLSAVPALRGLRRAFPGHEIVLALPPSLRDAALATGTVDTVLPAQAPGRGVPTLTGWHGEPPDVAVDLHGNGPESHVALAALGPRRILSYTAAGPAAGPPPVWRREDHERERWCRLLEAYGVAADPADVRLPPPSQPSPAPGAVVVHPGAEAAARRWPARHYATVARRLVAADCRVVVTGGPGEEELTKEVAEGAGLGAEDVFSGGLPFAELSALVAGASCFLSGDTGPAHLAVAHGAPSVTLFGPVAPRLWGPPPDSRHTALWNPGPPGDPHGAVPDPSLLKIGTVEVLAAVLAHTRREKSDDLRPIEASDRA
ncbi:glycosyltransferase family 9 protein [Streptomyces sp. CA-256286]|uniref:glycosyltransferase family 9 protein n=1 Tax=Streptomyces sp. CA-256286 TaxID=2801033 RepID=UPI001A99CAA7|nr:glycosyltransferase family 9 protein [Streptomyces sp. CA-256286]QTA36687.1 glycosyltransferase family 9 protein [Streptomyces sp. CA-256286]